MGGVYSYESFLLTFNTDDPRTIVKTFGLTELNKPSIFKDIVMTWSLAVFLSIEDNGVFTTEGYLDFHRFDIRKFTVFLTQQRRARRVELASAIASVTKSWKSVFIESEDVDGATEEKTENRSLARNENVSDKWNRRDTVTTRSGNNVAKLPNTSPLTTSLRQDAGSKKSIMDRSIIVDYWKSPKVYNSKPAADNRVLQTNQQTTIPDSGKNQI
jgi:hypothetical protein